MAGSMIEFLSNGRTTSGYLAIPLSGSGPGLIVIQEWWGLVGHITNVAERFAAEGFVALAPDLYRGERTKSPDQAGKLMMALDIAGAAKELRGAAEHLLALSAVRPKKVAAVGFCMGGQLALFAAQEHPDVIAGAVNFYGIHPNVPIEPARLERPVLAHFGKRDTSVKEKDARSLMGSLTSAGKTVDAYFYDAGHAFFNDERPEAYDAESAETAWQRTLDWLGAHLR
ncbi:MAG: dienelactone hydrolase family protein [Gemmatimonadota bacterium]|nr:dienelactone hydrolase family protein [Gemmatimonadota bacterium]